MIIYLSNRRIYADIFVRSVGLLLPHTIQKFTLENYTGDVAAKLLIVDGENLHTQTLKKIIRQNLDTTIILLSDKTVKLNGLMACVSNKLPFQKIAEICHFWLTNEIEKPSHQIDKIDEILLRDLALGKSNKEIAYARKLPLSTLKFYLQKLYKRMGVKNRTQAALKAREFIVLYSDET